MFCVLCVVCCVLCVWCVCVFLCCVFGVCLCYLYVVSVSNEISRAMLGSLQCPYVYAATAMSPMCVLLD